MKQACLILAIIACFNFSSAHASEASWVQGWRETKPLKTPRAGAAAANTDEYVYILGGIDGRQFLRSVELGKFGPRGEIDAWQLTTPLPRAIGFMDAVIRDKYLYVGGGGTGQYGKTLLRQVFRSEILADGRLGIWEELSPLALPRRCSKLLDVGNRLLALGGFGGTLLDSVESAEWTGDGLGVWRMASGRLTVPRYVNTANVLNSKVIVSGGHHPEKGEGLASVEWADVKSNPLSWNVTTPMKQKRYGHSAATLQNRIFVMGGISGQEYLDSVESSQLLASALAPWKQNTKLPEAMANFMSITRGNRIYVLGGTTFQRYKNQVLMAEVNGQGEIGFWGQANERVAPPTRDSFASQLPNQGRVLQQIQTSQYTYYLVEMMNNKKLWLAGPVVEVSDGQMIQFSQGVFMSKFYSRSLKRKFDEIVFVSVIKPLTLPGR